ncbi:hypothetical protein P0E55_13935 [Enterococcus faecalis]|uniref:hypothetical protein n=2 Tax=Bacilli TaxID=91061 RepID=UPI0025AF44D5|nr:hypothetical protein [Enterococcus faecalis]MDN3160803.1 hypothetical protein [Enterococcus faecalis]
MTKVISELGHRVLDMERTYPVQAVAETQDRARDLAVGLAHLRVCAQGIPLRMWSTWGTDDSGNPLFYSVHVEGYGAPIQVFVEDAEEGEYMPLASLTGILNDVYAMGYNKHEGLRAELF